MDISRNARIVMTHDAGGTSLKFTAIRGTPLRPGEARRGDNRRGREGQARHPAGAAGATAWPSALGRNGAAPLPARSLTAVLRVIFMAFAPDGF